MKSIILAISLFAVLVPSTFAQGKLEVKSDDTIRTILSKQVGQSVDLRLRSGDKISGKLASAGTQVLHVSQLEGAEYYDAVVNIDDVSAIVIRTKK
jgi:hypothetical protein